jgi:hypothetical protein
MHELSSIIVPNPKIIISKATAEDSFIEGVLAECARYKPVKQYVVYRNKEFFKLKEEVDAKIEKESYFEVGGIRNLSTDSKEHFVAVLIEYEDVV